MIYPTLADTISQLRQEQLVGEARRAALQPLIDYVQAKVHAGAPVNLHFICTHNSRRSHMAQVWAQAAALYFHVAQVHCYSGGTEATALFPRVAGTLSAQGFKVFQIAGGTILCIFQGEAIVILSTIKRAPYRRDMGQE